QRLPRGVWAGASRRQARGIDDPELLADLAALEVGGDLRLLLLRKERLIRLLERAVITRQARELGLARRRRLNSPLVLGEHATEAALVVCLRGQLHVEARQLRLRFGHA